MTKKTPQNIYDDPNFFAAYSAVRKKGFNKLIEQPAICSLLPNLNDARVIDLGSADDCWLIENYRDEKEFLQMWLVDNVIKYHRTLQTYINELINAGFVIEKILEPMPNDELISQRPDFKIFKIRPTVLMIKAKKLQ